METEQQNEVDRLAALQAVDCEIVEKQKTATRLEAEIQELSRRLAGQREQLTQLRGEQDDLDRQRRDLDRELEVAAVKIKGSRMRMAQVRTERERLAIQHEINVGKETTQQLDERLFAIMQTLEGLEPRVSGGEESLRELEAETSRELTARQEQLESLGRELEAKRKERDEVTHAMDPTFRAKYEQIFQRRGGTVVVGVKNGNCQGCHMQIPPQLYNELQKTRDLRQCPNCHRILFWRAEADPPAD